jgi:hypothetical protein
MSPWTAKPLRDPNWQRELSVLFGCARDIGTVIGCFFTRPVNETRVLQHFYGGMGESSEFHQLRKYFLQRVFVLLEHRSTRWTPFHGVYFDERFSITNNT